MKKFIVSGFKGELAYFETKQAAGAYLMAEGVGQDKESGYDLTEFSEEEIYDAAENSQRRYTSYGHYWHVEECAEEELEERLEFLAMCATN